MSQSAKVLRWISRNQEKGIKYSYGFAVTPKGETVFIPHAAMRAHWKEDDGNIRLQLGAQIRFDGEKSGGTLRATKVVGPGVVTWVAWKEQLGDKSKAMAMKAKEEWSAHKEAHGDRFKKKSRPSGGRTAGGRGGGEEKRKDTDGKFYTKSEFRGLYGGFKEWDRCAPKGSGRGSSRGTGRGSGRGNSAPAAPEKRKDTDGKFYTKKEFVGLYKGTREWDKAAKRGVQNGSKHSGRGGRAAGGHGAVTSAPEKRKDTDGGWYTKSEFFGLYKRHNEWDAAAKRGGKGSGGKGASSGASGSGPPAGYVCHNCSVKGHWIQQCPKKSGSGGGGKGGAEKRKDTDGGWYTKAEFVGLYKGTREWEAAAARSGALSSKGKGKGGKKWRK